MSLPKIVSDTGRLEGPGKGNKHGSTLCGIAALLQDNLKVLCKQSNMSWLLQCIVRLQHGGNLTPNRM